MPRTMAVLAAVLAFTATACRGGGRLAFYCKYHKQLGMAGALGVS